MGEMRAGLKFLKKSLAVSRYTEYEDRVQNDNPICHYLAEFQTLPGITGAIESQWMRLNTLSRHKTPNGIDLGIYSRYQEDWRNKNFRFHFLLALRAV